MMTSTMNRMIGRARLLLLAMALLLTSASTLRAQSGQTVYDTTYISETESIPIWVGGIHPETSLENWSVEMRGLPGIPSCCPEYLSGSGRTIGLDVEGGLVLGNNLRLVGEIGYGLINGTFRTVEEEFLDAGNGGVTGEIEHTIDIALQRIRFSPMLEFSPVARLWVGGGLALGITTAGDFEQTERLLSPDNVRFENRQRTRLSQSGSIPERSSILFGLKSIVRYELPLDTANRLHLVPFAGIDLDLSEGISGTNWRRRGLTFGLGVRYRRERTETRVIDTVITSRVLDSIIVAIPDPDILINVLTEHGNAVETIDSLHLDAVRTSTLVPLLNDIFFDEGSAEIPSRYEKTTAEETTYFSESQIDGEAFDIYYRILSIIGERMRRYPESTLNLVGCNTNIGPEKGNKELSRKRAESIRDYLVEIWQIAPERMTLSARNLPASPSPLRNEDGRSENRRVELSSSDRRIFAPVLTHDTAIRPNRSVIYFEMKDREKYHGWSLEARQGLEVIMKESGEGTPPEKIPLAVTSGAAMLKLTEEPIRYWLTLTDAKGELHTDNGEIGISRSESARQGSEAYWMVVFGYNRRKLGEKAEETIKKVARWVEERDGEIVEMVGQTDRSGNANYNKILSRDRAAAVAKPLNVTGDLIRGVGNTLLEYPNDLPEGRYYSRNVKVVTRTDE